MSALFVQLHRFLLVGMINTGVGLSIIWSLMWSGLSPITANLIGYMVGGGVSFYLNGSWTFATKNHDVRTFGRFLIAFFISYCVNFISLKFSLGYTELSPYLLQCVAVGMYSICFFVLSRHFVFKV